MRPVSQTPTETSDYAVITGLYGTLLGATAIAARGREPIPRGELPVLACASFALSKLIVHEKVETWMRRPFVDERPDGRRPKGTRLRYVVGELLTCTRCTGAWSALGLVGLRMFAPATGRTVASVLAASAGNDMLHATFTWLCGRANEAQASGDSARARPAPARAA